MIPKVIHYCWFGGNPRPANTKKYIESWKKYCPDYEIKEWNESNFDVFSHPFMKAAYEAKAWAFVSDYARLKIIYDNGGVYLDTDVELLKNIDFLLENNFFIGTTQVGQFCTTGLGFGAEKHNTTVERMMDEYNHLVFDNEKKRSFACPALNDRVLVEIGHEIKDEIEILNGCICILPARYMDPISPGDSKNLLCSDTVSIHHYSASWESKVQVLKRRVCILIGQKNINKLKNVFKRIK